MPTKRNHRSQTQRRLDVMKVRIEDVNLNASVGPTAQGRDHVHWGLFDIDLTHAIGGHFPTPVVGEVWWIKRSVGSRWVLDHKVDANREDTPGEGGGDGDTDRPGVPANVDLSFNVREKKKELEYSAFVTFDAVTTDENGDAQDTDYYVIDWVPTTKIGNIVTDEKVRQHIWNANDPLIDDALDPSADYYVELPGNVPRPKVWYWKGRVRAVSGTGHKGPWSDWTTPSLPFRDSLPEPPAPDNVVLDFKWRDTNQAPIWSGVVKFDDVNYWDIPGFDYEDDVSSYHVVMEPLERDSAGTIDGGDGHMYKQADPNNDGEPWPIRQQNIKDKDADDTFVTLGVLAEGISELATTFTVDETGVVGSPSTPLIVETNLGERWLVTSRTLVAGSTYTYEVYRQFNNTGGPAGQAHALNEPLLWLKDPYRYKVQFNSIHRPHTVYWRARVRSKDRFNRLGPYSDWTTPITPWQSVDFRVPKPDGLRASIHIREYKTHPEYKLVATFRDPAPHGWNLPGGDLQDDLDHYIVVGEALVPDDDGYIDGGDGQIYRIPDRRVGIVIGAVNPADTGMTIALDPSLAQSFRRIIDNDERFFLRIETVNPEDPTQVGNEVVAVEQVIHEEGDPDTNRTLTIFRAQKGSGDHGHNDGDAVFLLTEHVRRKTVHDRDEGDPGHFNAHYSVDLGHIPHASRLMWHIRARSVDGFNHKSDWTPWTKPINPANDPDLILPAPGYVRLSFDRVHRSRWTRWRAIVEFAEVDYLAPDGDREPDVTRYFVQLASTDGDELDLELNAGETTLQVQEKRRAPGATPFFILMGDEIMEVTARTQIDGMDNVWQYSVTRAQNGTSEDPYHPQGARIFKYPFHHETVSAKTDHDRNDFNRAIFHRAQKFRHYKARVRAHDRFNRNSEWSAWTDIGTPNDTSPPPPPTDVLVDVDNHKIVVNWDYPTEPDDNDPDLSLSSDEAAFFQVQVSTHSNFSSIFKFDRYVAATHKTFRVKKPGMGTYYVRVRAVDGSGNKSAWVQDSGAQNGVPTPDAPVLSYDVNEVTKHIRALVLLEVGVLGIDDDVDGYEFELQPAEFKRLTSIDHRIDDFIHVTGSNNIPPVPFVIHIQKERLRVNHVDNNVDRWRVIHGLGASTATKHAKRTKVQYFRNPSLATVSPHLRRHKTGEEAVAGDPVLCIFHSIQRGLVYRARVRAHNTKGLWGDWSAWSRG